MACSPDEDKINTSSSLLEIFKDAWNELKATDSTIGDGYVEIINRFGERTEYTALSFWELVLREFEDQNTDFIDESQIKHEIPIFTDENNSQITNTYFENLILGKDQWFLVQDFAAKTEIINILRRNLENDQNDNGGENSELYLKLITALENSPPRKTTVNKLLEDDDNKKETPRSSPRPNIPEQPRLNSNRNQNYRHNRQDRPNVRQNLIRTQPMQSYPINMPLIQHLPYNPPFSMPAQPLYSYDQMYYPMSSPPMRLPFPTPMPAVYPVRSTVPAPISIPMQGLSQPPVYMPGYVRYPPSIVYSQVIPEPPVVGYQGQQYPNAMDLPYAAPLNQQIYMQNHGLINNDEFNTPHLGIQDQNIVYFYNEHFSCYSDNENNGSECGSSCSCSLLSVCSECVEESNANKKSEKPKQSSKQNKTGKPSYNIPQEPSNNAEPAPLNQETSDNETAEKETVSSNAESTKESSVENITAESQSSSGDNIMISKQESSTASTVQDRKLETTETLYLPSTSKSADNTNIRSSQHGAIPKKKTVRFAENLPKLRDTTSQEIYDERLYLRIPTIFEILDSRKHLNQEEANRPPTNYMEDVIQRKERRWKQMDKIPGSPSLDTILDMIKRDNEMLEEEEREKQRKKEEKMKKDMNTKVIELRATPARLAINIQAQETSAADDSKCTNNDMKISASPSDETEVYEPIIFEAPIIIQPYIPEKTVIAEDKPTDTKESDAIDTIDEPITAPEQISQDQSTTDHTKEPQQSVIDEEERILLDKLVNSSSGYKEVWVSDKTVTELKDKLFEKWCKPKPKPKTRTATTICTKDQQVETEPEQTTTTDTTIDTTIDTTDTVTKKLPQTKVIPKVKARVTKEKSTQTNVTKPVKPIVRHNKFTQTRPRRETRIPEVVTYASIVRKTKK